MRDIAGNCGDAVDFVQQRAQCPRDATHKSRDCSVVTVENSEMPRLKSLWASAPCETPMATQVRSPMETVQQNYIGGTWVPAGATAPNVNPSNLNDVVANYARAQPAEAEAAIAAAKAAFSAYSRSTPQQRYEALKKVSDEILARKDELGRPHAQGRGWGDVKSEKKRR